MKIYQDRRCVVEYPLPPDRVKNARFSPEGQPQPRHLPKHRKHGSQLEEKRLRAMGAEVAAYLDWASKTPGIQRHRFLRELFALSQKVTHPVLIQTLQRALRYRVVSIDTLHRIAWLCMTEPEERLLKHVLHAEYRAKSENARILRRKRARIPELLEIETYPFIRQPKLDRKKIMSLYDSFDYITKKQNIVWLGRTGVGKTGLATGFLLQAIDRGYRGCFITFPELVAELYSSLADHSEKKVMRKYSSYDCLLIDEIGYVEVEPAQVGLFFTLMQKRHQSKTTLITSNLGFSEWGSFLKNNQLTDGLLSRLTATSYVFNMKSCKSLRDKLDENADGDG